MKEIDKEQIAQWKKEHGDVYRITDEDKSKACYLKQPSRKTMSYAATFAASNPVRSNEVLLEGMWLGGDEDFKTDDRLFFGITPKLQEIAKSAEVELEKL
ncbi:MAG: hypothetical protein LBR10_12125 [Prevotellaceae bacterium]|jgi:hypothetical protein|nr:hypothetical protein [Prevotellaceae bacterium]